MVKSFGVGVGGSFGPVPATLPGGVLFGGAGSHSHDNYYMPYPEAVKGRA